MASPGHTRDAQGRSAFRVFAPGKQAVAIVLTESGKTLQLSGDAAGFWSGSFEPLPAGTLYLVEADGRRLPDPASRSQPRGVHGPSQLIDIQPPKAPPGWRGVAIEDAVIYELHVGTFTPEGTLAAAAGKLPHLQDLGITVIELLPLAAFPGERNWGYDGTCPFALHPAYGSIADLQHFVRQARERGMAVILDVVFNHFGPEGHYGSALAPYTKNAPTPWGAAVNFDAGWSHGVREFFLDNTRFWLQEVGLDGFRMDAVSLIFDNSPVHILREITDLARAIGQAEGREALMIAEHLRNNRFVTSPQGFGFHSQWSDDLNHAVFACLTGEAQRHYANFGSFEDVVLALLRGFVLDGTRFDRLMHCYTGTDGRLTQPREHVVHIQNHDQVGNRLLGDRMIAAHGRDKALLAITAVLASPFVPMLFMGEEYGETAPFLFHEDFSDPLFIDGAREGRKADFGFAGIEPADPHDRASFEASKLQWERVHAPQGQEILGLYKQLIALKRSGRLGPRTPGQTRVTADTARQLVFIETPHTLTAMNFSDRAQDWSPPAGWQPLLATAPEAGPGRLAAFAAVVLARMSPGSG
jgi:maltooligosyltrehalose trehalohydrolase